jgi:uncharacterized cupredoxin-like copper-binding protein
MFRSHSPRRRRRVASLLATCAALACTGSVLLGAGCGSAAHVGTTGTLIGISERDFHISASTARVAAGDVTLRIHNGGPDQHELIVVPQGRHTLPMRSDGFTVNEEAIQNSEPGSITPQRPGGTENLQLHLTPGRYLLFCNMEGHYMGGMHTVLVVTS